MVCLSIEDLNNCWSCERIIELLDDCRSPDAKAIATEWGYPWEEED